MSELTGPDTRSGQLKDSLMCPPQSADAQAAQKVNDERIFGAQAQAQPEPPEAEVAPRKSPTYDGLG